LGGGTFDITIMKVNGKNVDVIASGGDHKLGGKDLDDCLISFFQQEFEKITGFDPLNSNAGQQELRSKAEETKRKLSSSSNARVSLSVEGRQAAFKITQNQFEELIDELILRTEMSIELILDEAGLSSNNIDDVLLVGGSTRIPKVGKMLAKLFGKEPLRSVNPDEVVAQGAAILANTLSAEASTLNQSSFPSVSDVCAHSLGISCLNDDHILENSIIIPKNSKVPCSRSQEYGTVSENQRSVEIKILQGEDKDPEYCDTLGKVLLDNLPPSPSGSPLEVVFQYDENGILNVKGVFLNSGQSISAKIEVHGAMSPEDARKSRDNIKSISVE
jgi:molecular chaperone DnaK